MTFALRRLSWGVAVMMALGFSAVWLGQVQPVSLYLEGRVPPGQAPYMAMRWLGLFALLLLWLQLMVGILFPASSREDPQSRAALVEFHSWLGPLSLLVVLSHPFFFMLGIYQRTHHIKWDLLAPHFDQGFYPGAISLGLLGLYLLVIGSAAAGLRRTRWLRRRWMKVHRLNGLAYVLVTVHAVLIGSETRFFTVLLLLILSGAGLLAALRRRWTVGQAFSPPVSP